MKNELLKIATDLDSCFISEDEARARLLKMLGIKEQPSWTMERLYRVVSKPKPGDVFEAHLKHLWDNNNPKSIFAITGLDVSHLMWGKEDTSGLRIKDVSTKFNWII